MIDQFSEHHEIQPCDLNWNFCEGRSILAMISFLDELAKNHAIDPVYKAIKSQGAQQNKRVGKKMTGRSAPFVFCLARMLIQLKFPQVIIEEVLYILFGIKQVDKGHICSVWYFGQFLKIYHSRYYCQIPPQVMLLPIPILHLYKNKVVSTSLP